MAMSWPFLSGGGAAIASHAGESGQLAATGRRLFTADNSTPWFGVGVSAFTLLQDFLERPSKVGDFLLWAQQRSLQWVRVFGQFNGGIGRFIPADYGSTYFTAIPALAEICAMAGLRMEFVAFADCQNAPLSFDAAHFGRVADAIGQAWNVILSGGNEQPFNGFDPLRLRKPAGLLSARCSMGTDALPFDPPWDVAIYEGARDDQFERKYKAAYDLYHGEGCPPVSVPILVDEMIGIGDVNEPGRTTNDPFKCWQFTAGLKLMGATGVCAHLRSGITGNVPAPGGPAEQCIDAMVAAGQLPLGANAFAHYERGNAPNEGQNPRLPIQHHDREPWAEIGYPGSSAGSLRTHGMIDGNRAEVIAPGAGPDYHAIAVNGWRISQAFSYQGHPANVLVCER